VSSLIAEHPRVKSNNNKIKNLANIDLIQIPSSFPNISIPPIIINEISEE